MSQQKLYDVYDDATQVARQIPRYPKSYTRVPASPLIERPLTLSEISGPKDLAGLLHAGPLDLSRSAEGKRAVGQLIWVTGKVCDEDGSPIQGAVLEIWQANSSGRYAHPNDDTGEPLDPDFDGFAVLTTGADGRYAFKTVRPKAYRVSADRWRPAHIHFSVTGKTERLVTQMYFPGDPLFPLDAIACSVPEAARHRIVCKFDPETTMPYWALSYLFDFVLRGRDATPMEN